MSADYDKVMGFFDFTHRFFDRLSIIEKKTPKLPPFQRCVTRVFSSMLRICSVAQKYAAEKRFSKLSFVIHLTCIYSCLFFVWVMANCVLPREVVRDLNEGN